MTDTTASILEAIVSQHASPYTSKNPTVSLFQGDQPPIHPQIRCSYSVDAEGPTQPGSVVRFRLPPALDCGIHILESVWIEFTINDPSGFQDPSGLIPYPAGLNAFSLLELRASNGTKLETMLPDDIHTWQKANYSTPMIQLANTLAHGIGSTTLQIPIPLAILKDTHWFPYLSLKNGMEIRMTFSPVNIPNLLRKATRVWLKGYAIPTHSFPLYELREWILPITTLRSQQKVFEKGTAATEETFLLEDPRDLQELFFLFRPDPQDPLDPLIHYGPGNPVYDAFQNAWIEIGTSRITDPLRHQIVRTISFLKRHARVPDLQEGVHCIPISNATQPSLLGYSAPGLMSHIQPKISLKMRFNPIDRTPGDRVRFVVYALMVRGQRLKIQNGEFQSLDESFGNPRDDTLSQAEADPMSEINPDDPGSLATSGSSRPPGTIGYLPNYQGITHTAFSRITKSFALRGSHAPGDVISTRVPLETDFLSTMTFRTRLPMLPNTLQWVNGVGYSLFRKIVVRHEDTILLDIPAEAMFLIRQQDMDLDKRAKRDCFEYGYRSPNAPDVGEIDLTKYRETASPDGYLRINIPWSFSQKGFPPLPTAALRDRSLEIEFHLAKLEDLIVDTSGAGVTGLRLTETQVDIVGYTIPSQEREKIMEQSQVIRCLQYRMYDFLDEEGTLRVLPVGNGVKRLIMTSPTHGLCSPGERGYAPVEIVQVYADSTPWYRQGQPTEFFEEWSRWQQGIGQPDIRILCLDNRPGFVNASRFNELRIQTTPGRLRVLAEIEEFYRIQKGKIGPLYAN